MRVLLIALALSGLLAACGGNPYDARQNHEPRIGQCPQGATCGEGGV